jgi:hypothetical protein
MIRLVLRRSMVGLLLRALFKRRKRHHWGQEHAEHLAEGKKRRQAARESAVERARVSLQPLATRRSAAAVRKMAPKTSDAARPSPGTESPAADAG